MSNESLSSVFVVFMSSSWRGGMNQNDETATGEKPYYYNNTSNDVVEADVVLYFTVLLRKRCMVVNGQAACVLQYTATNIDLHRQ
jgi:hypothetical protein